MRVQSVGRAREPCGSKSCGVLQVDGVAPGDAEERGGKRGERDREEEGRGKRKGEEKGNRNRRRGKGTDSRRGEGRGNRVEWDRTLEREREREEGRLGCR